MEQGHIDGVIWSRLSQDQLPNKPLKTFSQTYSQQEIAKHPDIYLIPWAP